MSDKRDRSPIPMAKGSTRTDFRMTRAPADTPRGRLHQLAALGLRAGQEAKRVSKLSREEMARLRALGQRGVDLLRLDNTRGGRLVSCICHGLDQAIAVLALLDTVDVVAVCDGLTVALLQLEVAESTIRALEHDLKVAGRDLRLERGHNEQLRQSLADEQVRTAVALRDIPAERWEEPTRNSTLTEDQVRAMSEQDVE